MSKLLSYSLGLWLLATLSCAVDQLSYARNDLNAEHILKQLVSEIPELKIISSNDLEPNPQGIYHRHPFIRGDFNGDGVEDMAICATDEWVQQKVSRTRNGYVLIATKKENGTWSRVFFHKFSGTASPFLIWDKERMALLVGANESDSNPGDIVWDRHKKEYKVLRTVEK